MAHSRTEWWLKHTGQVAHLPQDYSINHYSLSFISDLLYNEAWEYYEIDKNKYKREYRQKFLSAWKIAEFTKDWTSIAFYKEREKKYLS